MIRQNLERVHERMAESALRAGRQPAAVRLVAVSKTFPAEDVLAAWECGQRDFGENRPQQALDKIARVNEALGEQHPIWHMIGHIQSRQAKWVAAHYDWVHSVNRQKIAQRLSRKAAAAGQELPVLLECNVSGEESKYGYQLSNWERSEVVREQFFQEVAQILALPALRVAGLMTMAPWVTDPETVRPVFVSLRGLRELLRERFPAVAWAELSMGMTDDFEVAVEEGATLVRVGRAIFGERGKDW
ncbi:MAG TPA: YggS family pyridoxal phosphate-dependent enzyme [Thermoflexia bacterium]|nr:YggS family pyridoxal phosphate-dependent enzyme [Thermoflexia bacterium]